MKAWFDTEFQDYRNGKVELLSIGVVREDGAELYAENGDADLGSCEPWVIANVVPMFTGPVWKRDMLAQRMHEFLRPVDQLWGYYVGYDWWLLCQLLGGFSKMPPSTTYIGDVMALAMLTRRYALPLQPTQERHHALYDARWTRTAFEYVRGGLTGEGVLPPRAGAQ